MRKIVCSTSKFSTSVNDQANLSFSDRQFLENFLVERSGSTCCYFLRKWSMTEENFPKKNSENSSTGAKSLYFCFSSGYAAKICKAKATKIKREISFFIGSAITQRLLHRHEQNYDRNIEKSNQIQQISDV